MAEQKKGSLSLDYPCAWGFKIIGQSEEEMRRAVAGIIRDRPYRLILSRSSETGKFHCLNVELSVESEGHRLDLYASLKGHPAIKLVL